MDDCNVFVCGGAFCMGAPVDVTVGFLYGEQGNGA